MNKATPTVALDVVGAASILGTLNMNSNRINNLLDPSSSADAATKSYVDNSIPVGGIIMWSGTTGTSLPSNWKLCDGSTYNSITTPDLRGRFVLSSTTPTSANGSIPLAGGLSTRAVDASGGVESVGLTEAQMPGHRHEVSARTGDSNGYATDGAHGHSVADPGHSHTIFGSYHDGVDGAPKLHLASWSAGARLPTEDAKKTGISVNTNNVPYNQHPIYDTFGTYHNHTITVTETIKGSGSVHENMPPFYVLAFIMRIS